MASGRRLRTRSSGVPAQQLSECGHDRSQLDFSSDRDIQCKICWENREILIQRLIEPFEHALETLKDNTDSGSVNSTPERVSSAVMGSSGSTGRTRSLRRRAGKKRTRSISPVATAATTPIKTDGEDLLRSGGPGTSKPEEEDCIHVQDISVVAIPRPKKRSKSPSEQSKMVKVAPLELQKASANITPPAVISGKPRSTGGATTEKLQENPSLVDAAPAATPTPTAKLPKVEEKSSPTPPALTAKLPKQKPRASQLPPRGGQQTLFSFFAKSADSAAVKTENTIVNSNVPRPAPIFIAGGGGGGIKKKELASSKVSEEIVVRKSTPPAPPPARTGTRKSARDVTVKSRETVNYREDSDSDIDIE